MDEKDLFAWYERRLARGAECQINEIWGRDRAFVNRIQRITRTLELDDSPEPACIEGQQMTAGQIKKPARAHDIREHKIQEGTQRSA